MRGLRTGADGFVLKPFGVVELIARVEAALGCSAERPKVAQQLVTIAGRRIDFSKREALMPGPNGAPDVAVELTEREVLLLAYLVANPERAIDREEFLRYVWKIDPKGLETRTVDMLVARLRERLADDPNPPAVIATVRGKGYRLATPPGHEPTSTEAPPDSALVLAAGAARDLRPGLE